MSACNKNPLLSSSKQSSKGDFAAFEPGHGYLAGARLSASQECKRREDRDLEKHDRATGFKAKKVGNGQAKDHRYDAYQAAEHTGLFPAAGAQEGACHGNCHHRAYDKRSYGARGDGNAEGADEDEAQVDELYAHARDACRRLIEGYPEQLA